MCYELARALDTSIVAAAGERWLRRQQDPIGVTQPNPVNGMLEAGFLVANSGRAIRIRTASVSDDVAELNKSGVWIQPGAHYRRPYLRHDDQVADPLIARR